MSTIWLSPLVQGALTGLLAGFYASNQKPYVLGFLVGVGLCWATMLAHAIVTTLENGRDRRGQMMDHRRRAMHEQMRRDLRAQMEGLRDGE